MTNNGFEANNNKKFSTILTIVKYYLYFFFVIKRRSFFFLLFKFIFCFFLINFIYFFFSTVIWKKAVIESNISVSKKFKTFLNRCLCGVPECSLEEKSSSISVDEKKFKQSFIFEGELELNESLRKKCFSLSYPWHSDESLIKKQEDEIGEMKRIFFKNYKSIGLVSHDFFLRKILSFPVLPRSKIYETNEKIKKIFFSANGDRIDLNYYEVDFYFFFCMYDIFCAEVEDKDGKKVIPIVLAVTESKLGQIKSLKDVGGYDEAKKNSEKINVDIFMKYSLFFLLWNNNVRIFFYSLSTSYSSFFNLFSISKLSEKKCLIFWMLVWSFFSLRFFFKSFYFLFAKELLIRDYFKEHDSCLLLFAKNVNRSLIIISKFITLFVLVSFFLFLMIVFPSIAFWLLSTSASAYISFFSLIIHSVLFLILAPFFVIFMYGIELFSNETNNQLIKKLFLLFEFSWLAFFLPYKLLKPFWFLFFISYKTRVLFVSFLGFLCLIGWKRDFDKKNKLV